MKATTWAARQWRGIAILGCFCVTAFFGLRLPAEDPGPFAPDLPDAPAADEVTVEDGIIDLDGVIELTVNGDLRSRTRTEHSVSVTVKNVSDEPVEGPLVLVVDNPGLEVLELSKHDGTLSTGEPYLELLDEDATLRAGGSLRPARVEFASEEAVPLAERQAFAPEFRVVRLTEEEREKQNVADESDENIPGKSYTEEELARVMAIQEAATLSMMQENDGVFGTAVAEDDQGNLVIRVYTERAGIIRELPGDLEGIPLQQKIIGEPFHAGPTRRRPIYVDGKPVNELLPPEGNDEDGGDGEGDSESDGLQPIPDSPPSPGEEAEAEPELTPTPIVPVVDPRQRFPRPAPIGVSGFATEAAFLNCGPDPPDFCATGTVGCRCIDAMGNQFALSNLHVIGTIHLVPPATPIPVMVGLIGSVITQPGVLDNGCFVDLSDRIGVLADFEPIFTDVIIQRGSVPGHVMDAAIVALDDDAMDAATPAGGYGAPSRDVAEPRIGMFARKFGRTTINTVGQITALNVASIIVYSDCDSGGPAFFIKQIEFENTDPFGQAFGGPGDSGSLIVQHDPAGPHDRRPIGLLFAGGPAGTVDATLANPIGPILTRFGLEIDDGSGEPSAAGISGTMGGVLGPLEPPSEFR